MLKKVIKIFKRKPKLKWNEKKYPTYDHLGYSSWDDNDKHNYRFIKNPIERQKWIDEHYIRK